MHARSEACARLPFATECLDSKYGAAAKTPGLLAHCRSYAHFCACGKMLDARLEQLGAKRFSGRADVNREDWKAVDAWIQAAVADLDSLHLKAHSSIAGAAALSGQCLSPSHATRGCQQ